jgi:toxin ParE1/3/4
VARFRLARPAELDLEAILEVSGERWGSEGRARYAALLLAAMRAVAAAPDGPLTRSHPGLPGRPRSFHLRHARRGRGVGNPVHVVYFRIRRNVVEILRVLHEQMDPGEHLEAGTRR